VRVWRRVELDRVAPGRWRLAWQRKGTRTGLTEEASLEGPPGTVLRLAWELHQRSRRWFR